MFWFLSRLPVRDLGRTPRNLGFAVWIFKGNLEWVWASPIFLIRNEMKLFKVIIRIVKLLNILKPLWQRYFFLKLKELLFKYFKYCRSYILNLS